MNLLWKLALRNLFRNQRRSLTTGIGIAAGFIGLSLVGAYILQVQKGLVANAVYLGYQGHLQIHKKDSLDKFALSPKKYLIGPELDQKLDELLSKYSSLIEFQGKFLTGSGLIVSDKTSHPFLALGLEKEILPKALNHPMVMRWARTWTQYSAQNLTPEALGNENLISITPKLAEILGRPQDLSRLSPEQKDVQLLTRNFFNDLNAVNGELGVLHSTAAAFLEDTSIRLPLKLLQELLSTEGYQYRALFLKDADSDSSLQKNLQADIEKQDLPFEVFRFTQVPGGEYYVGTMSFLYVMGVFFVVLICGMVILTIVNSLTLGILERTRELGTLKALGFSGQEIVGLFVRESVWLAGLSLGLALVLSISIARMVNAMNFRFTPPGVEGDIQFLLYPDFGLYVTLALLLFGVAIVTAYQVSRAKMKMSAIQLLSESGV